MTAKKIAIIGTTASNMYLFRADLIRLLIENGHKVYTLVSEYNLEQIDALKAIGAIPITYALHRGGLNPISDILHTYQLKKILNNLNLDIVFPYSSKPVIYGTIAAKWAKIPTIVGMLEGLGYTFTEQPKGISKKAKFIRTIQIMLYRLSFPFLDKLIFLNSDDPVDLLDKNNIKVKEINILGGIGLNLKDYPYTPVDNHPTVSFLFIARLLAEKGTYEFLEAAQRVKAIYPKAHFIVLGSLDQENPGALSEKQLQDMISLDLIEYPGYVNDIPEWIKKSSVFVLPSYREGIPRSTQEAMAIGRPIITTDVPGCRETVLNGVNGFLIPPWNVEKLAEKMIYFIENPEQIRVMGDASFHIAQKKFNATEINQRLSDILLIQ